MTLVHLQVESYHRSNITSRYISTAGNATVALLDNLEVTDGQQAHHSHC
jgi:hypothetical protein